MLAECRLTADLVSRKCQWSHSASIISKKSVHIIKLTLKSKQKLPTEADDRLAAEIEQSSVAFISI